MGLVAVPLGGMILITSKGECPTHPEDRDAWAATIRAVPSEDADGTDRFQSAARWRGESTPRALAAGESHSLPGAADGWRTWRIVASGWPPVGASVSLVNGRIDRTWGWFVASLVLIAGLLGRGCSPRVRAIGLAAIGAAASVGIAWTWPEVSSISSGLLKGTLGVLAFWFGRSCRPSPAQAQGRPVEVPTTSRRSGFAVGSSLLVILGLAMGLGVASAESDAETDAPILALFPFDGPPDPESKPDRVVMRVKDLERLEALSRRDEPRAAAISIVSVAHKVAPRCARPGPRRERVSGRGRRPWTLVLDLPRGVRTGIGRGGRRQADAPGDLARRPLGPLDPRRRRKPPIVVPPSGPDREHRPGGGTVRLPINRAAVARSKSRRGMSLPGLR